MNDDKKLSLHDLNLLPIDQELDVEQLKSLQLQEEDADTPLQFKLASRREERQLAFYLLYALDRSDYSISLEDMLQLFEREYEFSLPRTSPIIKMVTEVVEKRQGLDDQLVPYLRNWRLERLGCCTRLILQLGLWELQEPGSVTSIVINEAVELAKMFAEKDAYRFINGILDEFSKSIGKNIQAPVQE